MSNSSRSLIGALIGVQIFRDLPSLRDAVESLRRAGQRIAFVPTMGALHRGHMALVAEAAARADQVVVSIFVNPTQFGPNEDLSNYPRQEAADVRLLESAGVSLLWAPSAEVMYPEGFASTIHVSGLSEVLDGVWRPGHFDGVATVVAKLFGQVRPDVACFGEKDYQQLAIIRRMVEDLNLGVEIVGVATRRDADGLALSSRNAYLSSSDRVRAAALPQTLLDIIDSLKRGEEVLATLNSGREKLLNAGFESVDYLSLCDAQSLAAVTQIASPARLLVAARIGGTRLIDNMPVNP